MRTPDLFRLDDQVAFLSGAAGHLGREMAFALGEAGAKLILNGRNESRVKAFAEELTRAGIACECAVFDVTDLRIVRNFFADLERLHVLVNNAITMAPKSFEGVQSEDFDVTYRSSVGAAFEAVRAAKPALARAAKDRGNASVVNIVSMYASVAPDPKLYGQPGQMSPPHYGAAKAGLLQLTRHLAAELGQDGIRVNALSPGPFPRPEVASKDPAFAVRLAGRTMLGRTGAPEEIRGPILFLASRASSFVTGSALVADAGWTAW